MKEKIFSRNIMFYKVLLLTVFVVSTVAQATDVTIHKNETSGLLTWSASDDGFKVEFIQLLPDFIRAIYAKHNFPPEEVERAASYCVFGSIIKNTSDKVLSYRVDAWRYRVRSSDTSETQEWPVKTKTQWLQQWQKADVKFSWTLLPDIGEFSVGDWQQGFTTIKLPRTAQFDLLLNWQLDGVKYETVLPNLSCPPDLQIEPG